MALHNVNGVKVGVFGQTEHWKLDTKDFERSRVDTTLSESPQDNTKEDDSRTVETQIHENTFAATNSSVMQTVKISMDKPIGQEDTNIFSEEDFIKNPSLRYNPWAKTLLGLKRRHEIR